MVIVKYFAHNGQCPQSLEWPACLFAETEPSMMTGLA